MGTGGHSVPQKGHGLNKQTLTDVHNKEGEVDFGHDLEENKERTRHDD